ncbi:MAG: hypothetical protein HZB36_04440 [Candidatus Omnitrophica bacterium]|nr:hypothetical protein [Candidatus Omnitrophota bacterium]
MNKYSFTLFLDIAGFIIRVDSEVDFKHFRDLRKLSGFVSEKNAACDCRLYLKAGLPRLRTRKNNVFNPAGNWKISSTDKGFIVEVGTPYRNGEYDEVIVFNSDFTQGQVYKKNIIELSRYFLDQFLLINLLGRHSGFLLHACGLSWNGNGLVFCGQSGAGKSTLLRLFSSVVGQKDLLNDDRIAVRRYGKSWRIFGTPWHGEFPVVSSSSAPFRALYFIKHSKKNYLKALSTEEICRALFQHSLLPYWDEDSIKMVLDNFKRLAIEIPAYELGVVPDKRIIGFITSRL